MTLYLYKAIDAQGHRIKGSQGAANPIDLELHLKHRGLDLISAKPNTAAQHAKKVKRRDLITFFFNLDQLNRSGVPLLECLTDLHTSMDDSQFSQIIADLIKSIESGKQLSQAMSQHPSAFDKITLSLVHAGEESGKLDEVFKHLTESLKWHDEIIMQSKNVLLYPAFVGLVVIAATFFMMIYLVPQLLIFIQSMGQEIPFQTRLLLATSSLFVHYWLIIITAPFLVYAAYKGALKFNPSWQYHVDNLKLHIWPTGSVSRKVILARFANTFAMMYSSGISILDCIAHARDLADNLVIAKNLDTVIQEIESGNNLSQSFQHADIFPPLVIRMLKVGETTGQLDQALLNVSYFYDRDVKESIRKVQIMVEPTMTIVLGLILGWVMLSVLSPIYDIIGKVNM